MHAEAFGTRVFDESEWNWAELVHQHSLGWVVARDGTILVGFVNILWDGLVHAWLQDTMVAAVARGQGIGTGLVDHARRGALRAGAMAAHPNARSGSRSRGSGPQRPASLDGRGTGDQSKPASTA